MRASGPIATWKRARLASLAVVMALVGCEGVLSEGSVPRIDLGDAGPDVSRGDAGGPTPSLDASAPDPSDAGAPDPGRDAGPPPDPCAGLDATGVCAGNVARWCEAGALREQDCGTSGQICGDGAGARRCAAPPTPGCGNEVEREQLRLTNAERTAAGLGALVCDEGLTLAARLHSQDMCDQMYFDHDSLDGRSFSDRINAQGVSWSRIGENIARGQATPADVHDAWMNSSGHRANIMNGAFGRIGIGYVECAGRGPYWTQDFAN